MKCAIGSTPDSSASKPGPSRRALRSVPSNKPLAAGNSAVSDTSAGSTACKAGWNRACPTAKATTTRPRPTAFGVPVASQAVTSTSSTAARPRSAVSMKRSWSRRSAQFPLSSATSRMVSACSADRKPAAAPNTPVATQVSATL